MPSIYFIRCELTKAVKIGISDEPGRRLRQLQTANPGKLSIVGTIPGDASTEAAFHARFADRRMAGDRVRVTARTINGWRGKGTVLMSQYQSDDVLMISPDDRPRGTVHACRHEVVPIRGRRSPEWVEDILGRLHTED